MADILVVGIAGGTASGKTTLTRQLASRLGKDVTVIEHDSYYRAYHELSFEERTKLNYDHPDIYETELLVEEALKRIPPGGRFLDLCTGSGCIAVSLLCLGNNLSGCGCDLSEDALRIASSNARLHHVTAHLELRQGDLYDALSGETGSAACPSGLVDAPMRRNIDAPAEGWDGHLQGNLDGSAEGCDEPLRRNIDAPADEYDMIVSNPPYIASDKIAGLMEEVRDHEPVMALDGGADGLVFYRRILEGADKYLKRGGWLLVEIGYDQAGAVRSMFGDYRYESVRVIKDLAGLDRIVLGQRGNLCV